jgi:arylsulfatase A-like enzyme
MFTSVHPYQHGARTRPPVPLPEEALTIAELLRGEGYTTAAFTSGGQLDPVYGIAQGFDVYDIQGQRRFREVVEDALAWVDRAAPERLFLFLHTYEVHAPYDPPQEYLDLLPTADGSDTAGPVSIDTIDRLNRVIESDRSLDSADLARVVHAYDGEIRSVDSGFAALLQRLRQRGLYDASLILLTADHGEEFGEHDVIGRHSHTLHDEVVKVPLVVKFPRTAFAGSRIEAQVRGIDLAPTITDVVGIDAPGSFEGLSLVGAITGADAVVRWSLSERGGESPSFALRTDRWKLYDGRLFDLLADPGERADVSDRYPAVREAMETRLADALTLPAVGEAETVEPSEEVLRQLRALGYIR